MSNTYFQFKQFRIAQERCAMKVTTDACIQGAWTPMQPGAKHVLDIGAGTGLLSLMLAQRVGGIAVDAIEYEPEAAKQAAENVAASPWADRINVTQADARSFSYPHKYDLIIANPPFFNNSLLSDKEHKNRARHTVSLSYEELLHIIASNLSDNGYASVMLPYDGYLQFYKLMDNAGFHEQSRLEVRHTMHMPVNRVVCVLGRSAVAAAVETLVIKDDGGQYTNRFTELLAPYYLYL